MMATVTDFHCIAEDGFMVLCDAHGNNVAFRCQGCGGPVLAVMREHQRGSYPGNPAECRACHSQYWVEVDGPNNRLVLHRTR